MKLIQLLMLGTLAVPGLTVAPLPSVQGPLRVSAAPAVRAAPPAVSASHAVARVVLRLPYRGAATKAAPPPATLGVFDNAEAGYQYARFAGTDWQGGIYFIDPVTSQASVLKRFDASGQFRESWKHLSPRLSSGVAVTRDGYIWADLYGRNEEYPGLPIAVYRSGQKDAVIDWRFELPHELEQKIHTALKDRGLVWKPGWIVTRLETGPDQVAIQFYGEALGDKKYRVLWVRMRSDGSQVLDVRVAETPPPYLAPDGTFWQYQTDLNLQTYRWSKAWLWEASKERGEPLIDREAKKEPWPDLLPLGDTNPPPLHVDGQGNVYLAWRRDELPNPPERRFQIMGKILTLPPAGLELERALVVLDRQRRVVSHVPWTSCLVYYGDRWVAPLPASGGYYRADFTEREARIWLHPLPK
jgi:hypothetical protein